MTLVTLVVPANGVGADPSSESRAAGRTYQNPVSGPAAENFGSPTVIRARDGYWYAYGPGNPLNSGEPRPLFPILRSSNLTTWSYVGDVFTEETFPTWTRKWRGMWAPSIEYLDGRYHLYFTLTDVAGLPTPNSAIGVATAPAPAGPWTDSGAPLVPPSTWDPPQRPPRYRTIIDAEVSTTPDGTRYLYYGGFGGGVFGVQLSPDGLRTVGDERQLTAHSTYEGPYVVRREGWYYLFVSSGHCCRGPVTHYAVQVGRSRDPLGPFVDRQGVPLLADSPGGTLVIAPNGNRWVGTGHNAAVTDLAGQQWLTFNGIDRDRPHLGEPPGAHRRPLLLDRLDWIDGWPTVRGGAWASEGPTAAPVSGDGVLADAFESDRIGRTWRGTTGWSTGTEVAGRFLHTEGGRGDQVLESVRALPADVRVRGAVRLGGGDGERKGQAGFLLARHRGSGAVEVTLDRGARALVVDVRGPDGRIARAAEPVPPSFRFEVWHELAVEIRDGQLTASVSDAGLFDPVATVRLRLPTGRTHGPLALLARDTAADLDDVTAASLAVPHVDSAPEPVSGAPYRGLGDEFDDGLAPGWTWVRGLAATVEDGALRFPVQRAELVGDSNSASLLLRKAPPGRWIAETRVRIPFGDANLSGFPQAGLVVHLNDDHYLRLTTRAHGPLRHASYQKEMPYAGATVANAGVVGPVAPTTWLRLHHQRDPVNGEHELRAGVSRDGAAWSWAGTLTLPAGTDLNVGLAAHGAGEEDLSAQFDYFRFFHA